MKGRFMKKNKKISFVFGLGLILLVAGLVLFLGAASAGGREVAHHMAPNTNSVDIGNLNLDTVHNGLLNLGVMPVSPEIGAGSLNRQLWNCPPPMP